MDVIDGSLQSASPCPPELLIMAPRYSDPGNTQRSRHIRLPKSGTMDRGYHPLCWTSNIWNQYGSDRFNEVLKKFRSAEYRESVALEKGRILVWFYSGTLQFIWKFRIRCKSFDIIKKTGKRNQIYRFTCSKTCHKRSSPTDFQQTSNKLRFMVSV